MPEVIGKCKVCTINVWNTSGQVFRPCNLKNCPYETLEEQEENVNNNRITGSGASSGLAQIE